MSKLHYARVAGIHRTHFRLLGSMLGSCYLLSRTVKSSGMLRRAFG